jgi:hypothetical protein
MTNAPGQKTEGAAINMPGGHVQDAGSEGQNAPDAGCPTLHVELYRHTARLYGGRIWQLLELAGVEARQYDRGRGCWTVTANRVDDVICFAGYRQRRLSRLKRWRADRPHH